MAEPVFLPAEILLPDDSVDMERWAVLACDQFTSQPEYWQQVEEKVGEAPSTLQLIVPEVYLEGPEMEGRVAAIHQTMEAYLQETLTRSVNGFIYVEREISSGTRQGLVGVVDLEAYSYTPGAPCRIRPSEGTVVERIPPRLQVRRGASVEAPHILMLADDPEGTVIEPLAAKKDSLPLLYDQALMLEGGRVRGWAVTSPEDIATVTAALAALEKPEAFRRRYGCDEATVPFALAVGDGNHSLATAKAAWEELKPTLTGEEQRRHPARFCLVELENIQCPANAIEPIHRVAFGITEAQLLDAMVRYAAATGSRLQEGPAQETGSHGITLVWQGGEKQLTFNQPAAPLAVGTVEGVLALCTKEIPGLRVDYVHGEEAVRGLATQDAVGLLLPPFEKADLFRGVALGGVLPRKTFSMGHATEKRYYLECRQLRQT